MVGTRYHDKIGVPASIGENLLSKLETINKDQNALGLLNNISNKCSVDSGDLKRDYDYPEDLNPDYALENRILTNPSYPQAVHSLEDLLDLHHDYQSRIVRSSSNLGTSLALSQSP